MTVNFHSSEGIPGSEFLPPSKRKEKDEYQRLIVVNKESGKLSPLEHKEEYSPNRAEPTKFTPEMRINSLNKTEWDNQISQLILSKERADEILENNRPFVEHILPGIMSGKYHVEDLDETQRTRYRHFQNANTYLEDIHDNISSLYNKAQQFGDQKQKETLGAFAEDFRKKVKENPGIFSYSEAMGDFVHQLRFPDIVPQMYAPIEDFATEQSAKTFGNAAWQGYKQFKDKAPVLVIENPPAGHALSTGEDIKNIVEASRKQFVQNAVAGGMSEREAERNAEKFIGATWDVGHINMLRKYGYSEEEIAKEAEAVAPLIKHVHLSDNFGYEHTELPMGMGNVPLNEIMKKLGEKGFEATKIIEAGNWWQHFRTSPMQESLEAMGSPIYGMKMAPYWNQAPGLYQGYMSGNEGNWLPQTNYETFGTTFSRLPKELGGQIPGSQGSRMSGRPME